MRRCLADRVILFPSTREIEAIGLTRQEVTCPSGRLELLGKRSSASEHSDPKAFILSFVGNNGRAEGELRRALAPAALSAYDAIAARTGGRPILVTGHSLGAVPALAVSANRPAAGIVLHNPPPLREVIMGKFGWWNLWLGALHVARSVPSDLDSLANARASNCPAVFLLAGRDGLVPPRFQQLVVEAYAGPKKAVELPNARHNWPVTDEHLPRVKEALRWLWGHPHP